MPSVCISSAMRPFLPSTAMRACSMAARSPAAAMPASSSFSRDLRSEPVFVEDIRSLSLFQVSSSGLVPRIHLALCAGASGCLDPRPEAEDDKRRRTLGGGLLCLLDSLGSLLGERL